MIWMISFVNELKEWAFCHAKFIAFGPDVCVASYEMC